MRLRMDIWIKWGQLVESSTDASNWTDEGELEGKEKNVYVYILFLTLYFWFMFFLNDWISILVWYIDNHMEDDDSYA